MVVHYRPDNRTSAASNFHTGLARSDLEDGRPDG
jgi:hypothetical protein